MGLRELKKTRTRQAVQTAALRLFGEQGFEATTVEQIALAAEISTATFYRYYCDKEDVVFGDDDHALVEEVFAHRPAGEPLADTIRAVFRRVADQLESDKEAVLVRLRLMCAVPALRARRWAGRLAMIDLITRLIATRTGARADDHELRLAVTIALAAESETVFYWARSGGTEPLAELLDSAITRLGPVLAGWSATAASVRHVTGGTRRR